MSTGHRSTNGASNPLGGRDSIMHKDEKSVEHQVRAVLRDILGLSTERVAALTPASGLFGSMPELDSMAVAGLFTELEDRLGIIIDDDEIDAELLETFGGLVDFATRKVSG